MAPAKLFCQRCRLCYAVAMRILIWLSSCALAWSVSGAELHFNFGDYPEGSSPTNFHAALAGGGAAPDWKIVSAEVPSAFAPFNTNAPVVNHARVLAQTSGDMTDEHYPMSVSYTHLRAHETGRNLVCRLLL